MYIECQAIDNKSSIAASKECFAIDRFGFRLDHVCFTLEVRARYDVVWMVDRSSQADNSGIRYSERLLKLIREVL